MCCWRKHETILATVYACLQAKTLQMPCMHSKLVWHPQAAAAAGSGPAGYYLGVRVLVQRGQVGGNRGGTSVFQCFEGFVGNCGVGDRLARAL